MKQRKAVVWGFGCKIFGVGAWMPDLMVETSVGKFVQKFAKWSPERCGCW